MHGVLNRSDGKMGFGLLRYSAAPVTVVIDRTCAGRTVAEVTDIAVSVPIVASVHEALQYAPDVLVPAIAPTGGVLPVEWRPDIMTALENGLSVVNGLHAPLADDLEFVRLAQRPGQFLWDIRQEPPNLPNGSGQARHLSAKRVLFVGTDMANGKMTAALEMDRAARKRGLRSRFLATGQIGIAIAGEGVPLDAVRVDFASGAIEQMVMRYGNDHDILFIEGQGSLLHPGSTATLPLLRGAMPTHLILTHRAGQTHLSRLEEISIPPLRSVVRLYEQIAAATPEFPPARVCGIALNTASLSEAEAQQTIAATQQESGLPVTDVIRYGADILMSALL